MQVDPVDRRLLQGGKIPQQEKVFPVFGPHTRWIAKGRAGTPVGPGVPVCILEDRHGFILHHRVMWQGSDVDHAVPMVESAQRHWPELRGVGFDRGFHSPDNRHRLDGLPEHRALPKKGRPGQADRQREGGAVFMARRRRHPAVESAMATWSTGAWTGFARTVRRALPARWPCRCRRRPFTASACCFAASGRSACGSPPDVSIPTPFDSRPAGNGEPCPERAAPPENPALTADHGTVRCTNPVVSSGNAPVLPVGCR